MFKSHVERGIGVFVSSEQRITLSLKPFCSNSFTLLVKFMHIMSLLCHAINKDSSNRIDELPVQLELEVEQRLIKLHQKVEFLL